MVSMLVYVFGIVLLMVNKGADEAIAENFGSLGNVMWTLVMDGTLLDNTGDVLMTFREQRSLSGWFSVFAFLLFVLLSAVTVMNMLIGILCAVVSAVEEGERTE